VARKNAGAGRLAAAGVRELAGLIGRSHSTVSKWLRRPDWPFARTPPWNAVKVLAWAKANLAPNPAAGMPQPPAYPQEGELVNRVQAQAKAQLLGNRALLLRQRYDYLAGKLHDVERCQQRRLRQIHAVRIALLDLPRLAPPFERELAERIDVILKRFAGDEP
jgi:hypothetical protein